MERVFDEQGVAYELARPLGRGGQGEVWLTRDGRRVVKLIRSAARSERIRRQIARVRRMELNELPVARPIAMLQPTTISDVTHVGYVAEFLRDMEPLRNLLVPPGETSLRDWYIATGSLRRRLRLLARTAEVLDALHGRGLAYGDLSPNNVFVSEDRHCEEAWLIDLDNLSHESRIGEGVFTPGYGAPEVIDGVRGMSSFSDAWSLAALAVYVLRLVHPFLGDQVDEGEPELEEEAFAARLPWIEHGDDESNRSRHGIPRDLVFSKGLLELARRTFESPRGEVMARPTVARWVDRLHEAADATRRCSACSATLFAHVTRCTWCGHTDRRLTKVALHRWEPGHGIPQGARPVAQIALSPRESRILEARHCEALGGLGGRASRGMLTDVEGGVRVQPEPGTRWYLSEGRDLAALRVREVPANGAILPAGRRDLRLHFGPVETPHRVATFEDVLHERA